MFRVSRVESIQGSIRPPSDKSLTHRAYLLSSIASDPCTVSQPLQGQDCESTLTCLQQMGLQVVFRDANRLILSAAEAWHSPEGELDCGNSGTTMRLMSGLIASRPIEAVLIGDASLSRRPMGRIAEPLRLMGASIEGECAPLVIRGTAAMRAIHFSTPVASAQIKSCILLAALQADGVTQVSEPELSRDHTERMLQATGVRLTREGTKVSLKGGQRPSGFEFTVPADISSAAFWLVAAALVPGSNVVLQDVGLNPTRSGIFDVFSQAGILVDVESERISMGEPLANLRIRGGNAAQAFVIDGNLVPRLIDEIPVLAVLATQLEGTSIIRGAKELRFKESDRVETVAEGLRSMGANVETFEDGMAITGPTPLRAARILAHHDHRIAMAFAVAGLVAEGETQIEGAESIQTSYPEFEAHLRRLTLA